MLHKLKYFLSVIITTALILVISPGQAREYLLQADQDRPVRIGLLSINQDTNRRSRELLEQYIKVYLQELSKSTHLGYEYIMVTPEAGRRLLNDGELDLLAPVLGPADNTSDRIYSEGEAFYCMLSLFAVPDSKLNVRDSSTMDNITIGYVATEDNAGYITYYVESQGWHNIHYVTYPNGKAMIEALHGGEIQAAMDDGSNLWGNEIELAAIAIGLGQFTALPSKQPLVLALNNAIIDTELKNPSFGTRLQQEYIDPAIHHIVSYSDTERNYAESAAPLRVALPGSFPPFIVEDSGIFKDILDEIGKDSGLTFEIIQANDPQNAEKLLKNGEADIMAYVYSGTDYQRSMTFTNNFMVVDYWAIIHKETEFFNSPKSIAIPAKIPGLMEYVESQFPASAITTLDTVEACLDGVERREYTMALIPNLYLLHYSSLATRPQLKIADKHTCHVGLSFMASEATPNRLVHTLNTAIQRMSPEKANRIIKTNSHPVINFGYLLQEYPATMVATILLILMTALGIAFIVNNNRRTRQSNILLSEKNKELQQALDEVKALTRDRDAYKQESETDPLTGLLNKKGIVLRCHQLMKQTQPDEAIALIIIDLDHFKQFNDTYGHQAGDKLLVTFAKLLKRNCTDMTAAARFGGDEFLLMVPLPKNFSIHDIRKQAQWILTSIKNMMVDGHPANVSGSIGIAIAKGQDISYDDLFRHADRALYKVKAAGRDGFQIYEQQ